VDGGNVRADHPRCGRRSCRWSRFSASLPRAHRWHTAGGGLQQARNASAFGLSVFSLSAFALSLMCDASALLLPQLLNAAHKRHTTYSHILHITIPEKRLVVPVSAK